MFDRPVVCTLQYEIEGCVKAFVSYLCAHNLQVVPLTSHINLGRVSERTVCDPFFKHATVGYVITWLRPVTT